MSHESGDLNILVVFHFVRCSKTLGKEFSGRKRPFSLMTSMFPEKKINVQAHNAEPYIERI